MSAAQPGGGRPGARWLRARWLGAGWWGLLVLVALDRLRMLTHFSWVYTDKDQALLWTGTYEMMHGRFHEPRWYGQPYNTLLESLLAVPLVAASLPYSVALPIVSSALCLGPFVVISACALRAGLVLSAWAVLATPLFLPIRWGMLSSVPRGFVTGLIFAAIPAGLALFRPTRGRLFACGLLLVLSLSVNASAALLAVPVGVRLLLEQRRSRDLYLYAGAGALLAGALHVLSVAFYRWHPANVVYGPDLPSALAFDPALFFDNLLHPGRYLGDVSPWLPGGAWLSLALLALTVWGLVRRGAGPAALALVAGVGLVLFGLGSERLAEGSESVWWSWSRNFLAFPLLVGIGLVWLEGAPHAGVVADARHRLHALGALAAAAGIFFAVHVVTLDAQIARHFPVKNPTGLKGWSVGKVEALCTELAERAEAHGADLVVFRSKGKILCYACEAVLDARVKTLLLRRRVPERRTWRLLQEARRPARPALLYAFTPGQIARGRALGLQTGPPEKVGHARIDPVDLPPGREAFEMFAAMGVPGAGDLVRRLDLLGVH